MERQGTPTKAGAGGIEAEWSLVGILLAGLLTSVFLPLRFSSWPSPFFLGLVLALLGLVLIVWAGSEFSKHGTTLKLSEVTTVVVKSGPYKYTRNPIYISMMLVYAGIALMFDSPISLVLLIPVIFLMNLQAVREERCLEKTFGGQYIEYKQRVRRWL